ncbi:MAG TPA: PIN domain-containing protein [Candidatus Nanoarchaeia archaeon]|nr:PIN domain-containing protein [Candidatus Nanoarchaeia archaeon]
MIGLDTTAVIDLFRGDSNIKSVLQQYSAYAFTDFNYLELFFGLDSTNKQHIAEAEYYEQLFESVTRLSFNRDIARKASEIYWRSQKRGKTIGKFDCVIAAIYLANNVDTIITRNSKHFSLTGLKVISY